MRISIVVPTYNRVDGVTALLRSAREQLPEGWELILVDDCSTDGTAEAARPLVDQYLRTEQNSGAAAARNLGVRHARGKHILFIDSDVVLSPGLLAEVDRQLGIDPGLEALSFTTSPTPTNQGFLADYSAVQEDFYYLEYLDRVPPSDRGFITTRFGVVRKNIFEEIGGFDVRYQGKSVEDLAISLRFRQKHRTRFCLNPLPRQSWPDSLKALVTRLFRNSYLWTATLRKEESDALRNLITTPRRAAAVTISGLLWVCLAFAVVWPGFWWVFVGLAVLQVFFTLPLFKHFVKARGIVFALKAHLLNILLCIAIISGALLGFFYEGRLKDA